MTHRNVQLIAALEKESHTQKTLGYRLADFITRFVGSMTFVYLHVAWFVAWILLNLDHVGPVEWRFDPYPFTFLTFVVSLEAIFLSTFILISQNHEEKLAVRRGHLDLQINLLAEQENSRMLAMLEAIHQKLGIDSGLDDIRVLEEATDPQALMRDIKRATEAET